MSKTSRAIEAGRCRARLRSSWLSPASGGGRYANAGAGAMMLIQRANATSGAPSRTMGGVLNVTGRGPAAELIRYEACSLLHGEGRSMRGTRAQPVAMDHRSASHVRAEDPHGAGAGLLRGPVHHRDPRATPRGRLYRHRVGLSRLPDLSGRIAPAAPNAARAGDRTGLCGHRVGSRRHRALHRAARCERRADARHALSGSRRSGKFIRSSNPNDPFALGCRPGCATNSAARRRKWSRG